MERLNKGYQGCMFGINVQYDLETINGGVLKKERTETNIVPTISRVWTLDLTVQT